MTQTRPAWRLPRVPVGDRDVRADEEGWGRRDAEGERRGSSRSRRVPVIDWIYRQPSISQFLITLLK